MTEPSYLKRWEMLEHFWREEVIDNLKSEGYRVVKLEPNYAGPGGWTSGYTVVEEL